MTFSKQLDASFWLSSKLELLSQVSDVLQEVTESLNTGKSPSLSKTKTATSSLKIVKESIESHKDYIDSSINYLAPIAGFKQDVKMIEAENKKEEDFTEKLDSDRKFKI